MQKSEIKEPKRPVKRLKDGSVIFKHVSFFYPWKSRKNLKDITFHIKSGETVGIIGSTGSSKNIGAVDT